MAVRIGEVAEGSAPPGVLRRLDDLPVGGASASTASTRSSRPLTRALRADCAAVQTGAPTVVSPRFSRRGGDLLDVPGRPTGARRWSRGARVGPGRRPRVVFCLTITRGKIVQIDMVFGPAR
jgi:hypothetical protein